MRARGRNRGRSLKFAMWTHLPGAELSRTSMSRTGGQRAVGCLHSPCPEPPPPAGATVSRWGEIKRARFCGSESGRRSSDSSARDGLPVCLLQLFKLLQSARAPATFSKQLLISSQGELSQRGLGQPRASRPHSAPVGPRPRPDHR